MGLDRSLRRVALMRSYSIRFSVSQFTEALAAIGMVLSRGRTDFELLIAISNGVLFSPMHSWRGRLKDQEMMDVIQYIRTLAPERATS